MRGDALQGRQGSQRKKFFRFFEKDVKMTSVNTVDSSACNEPHGKKRDKRA
jgi:hypothetical protein